MYLHITKQYFFVVIVTGNGLTLTHVPVCHRDTVVQSSLKINHIRFHKAFFFLTNFITSEVIHGGLERPLSVIRGTCSAIADNSI